LLLHCIIKEEKNQHEKSILIKFKKTLAFFKML